MAWRIVGWQHFEPKHGSREQYRNCIPNVLIPTSTDSNEYVYVTKRKDGAKVLGVWLAVIQYWARQKKAHREGGWLWGLNHKPATAQDIADKSRLRLTDVSKAIGILVSANWLEVCQTDVRQASAANPCNDNEKDKDKEKDNVQTVTTRPKTPKDAEIRGVPTRGTFIANGQGLLSVVEQTGGNRRKNSVRAWDNKDLGSFYDFIVSNEALSEDGKAERLMAGLRRLEETLEKANLSSPFAYWKSIMSKAYPEWSRPKGEGKYLQIAARAARQS